MSDNPSSDRLVERLGWDPAKRASVTKDLFEELIVEAQAKRLEEAKEAARGKLAKAMELRQKVSEIEKKFRGERQKFEKEIGKLLNEIEGGFSQSQPQPAPTEPESSE